jgi:hypothetical protein
MPDDTAQDDAAIIRAAYAERVSDAFKVFAENLSTGQSEQSCMVRFQRALQLIRKTRDLALRAATAGNLADAEAAQPKAAAGEQVAGEGLSAEDQALIEQALAGTTGHAPPPVTPRYRR